MENIADFIKSVVAITFMWSIVQNMLPKKSFNKYTELIYGLVIMSVLVSALVNVKQLNLSVDYSKLQTTSEYTNGYVREVYEEELENILINKFNVDEIDVELDEDYKIYSITCNDEETYDAIMRYFNE